MTREEFYKIAKVAEEANNIILTLDVIDYHLNNEKFRCADVGHMIEGLFRNDEEELKGVSVTDFLCRDYFFSDTILNTGKEINIGDKNLLKAVRSHNLWRLAPEEMFVARDKFLNNLKKALEEVLAAIQLPKVEEKK